MVLLNAGAEPTCSNDWMPPLKMAIVTRQYETMVPLLLKYGADPNMMVDHGYGEFVKVLEFAFEKCYEASLPLVAWGAVVDQSICQVALRLGGRGSPKRRKYEHMIKSINEVRLHVAYQFNQADSFSKWMGS